MTNKNIFCIAFLLVFFVPVFIGCGNQIPTNITEIIVTINDQPIEGASINLIPTNENGMQAFGVTDANGKCMTQTILGNADGGTVVGEYIVTVSKMYSKDTGQKYTDPNTNITSPILEPTESLPAIYTSEKTSPFRVEVKKGKNSFKLELKE
ncbi:MAG: hypothetical protein LBH59_05305 [Planctomycetaceae bacterium]|jgi:hypothetical protein|nr:hypothetical protein [Planctomycetaceae bacterium]